MSDCTCHRPLGVVEIRSATTLDFPVIAALARRIWPAAYEGIISRAQIDYMLTMRYAPQPMLDAAAGEELAFELLLLDGEPVAFAAHSPTTDPGERKLNQLYVLPEWQGRGLGGRLLSRVESLALARGQSSLVLTVNRHNTRAQAVYAQRGFAVRETVRCDIGQGFVMDDFVMAKRLDNPPR